MAREDPRANLFVKDPPVTIDVKLLNGFLDVFFWKVCADVYQYLRKLLDLYFAVTFGVEFAEAHVQLLMQFEATSHQMTHNFTSLFNRNRDRALGRQLSWKQTNLDEHRHLLVVVNKFLQELVMSQLGAIHHNCVILLLEKPIARKRLAHLNLSILYTRGLKDKLLSFTRLVLGLRNQQYLDRLQRPWINFHFNY